MIKTRETQNVKMQVKVSSLTPARHLTFLIPVTYLLIISPFKSYLLKEKDSPWREKKILKYEDHKGKCGWVFLSEPVFLKMPLTVVLNLQTPRASLLARLELSECETLVMIQPQRCCRSPVRHIQ